MMKRLHFYLIIFPCLFLFIACEEEGSTRVIFHPCVHEVINQTGEDVTVVSYFKEDCIALMLEPDETYRYETYGINQTVEKDKFDVLRADSLDVVFSNASLVKIRTDKDWNNAIESAPNYACFRISVKMKAGATEL